MKLKSGSLQIRIVVSHIIVSLIGIIIMAVIFLILTDRYFNDFLNRLQDILNLQEKKIPKGFIISSIGITNEFLIKMKLGILYTGLLTSVVALFIGSFLARKIFNPVKVLHQAIKQVKRNSYQTIKARFPGEVEELKQSFNEMVEDLIEQKKLRSQLVANVSHELKTPLTSLQGYIEGMEDRVISVDDDTLKAMGVEICRLRKLVSDLEISTQDYSNTLEKATVDLKEFFEELERFFAPECKERGVVLHVHYLIGSLTWIFDSDRMKQVFVNLIDNALKYTPQGGEIHITYTVENGKLKIMVEDSGCGISSKEMPYIFERFYRGDESRSRKTGGAGIGLSIVKEIINAHQGEIHVGSTIEKGTVFTIFL